jgi:hypothetical protein
LLHLAVYLRCRVVSNRTASYRRARYVTGAEDERNKHGNKYFFHMFIFFEKNEANRGSACLSLSFFVNILIILFTGKGDKSCLKLPELEFRLSLQAGRRVKINKM